MTARAKQHKAAIAAEMKRREDKADAEKKAKDEATAAKARR